MRPHLAILLSILQTTHALALPSPRLDAAPSGGWKIKDPAFAEAVFQRFDFDAEARKYYAVNMKIQMLAVLQSDDCGVADSEKASWPYKLLATTAFDLPAGALVDRTRAVVNARVVSAVTLLDKLNEEKKADLISLPGTPMANTVVAAWLISMYEYSPFHDNVFPTLAKEYLRSNGFCPGFGQ